MSTDRFIEDDDARRDAIQRAVELMAKPTDAQAEQELAEITEAIAEYDIRRGNVSASATIIGIASSKE